MQSATPGKRIFKYPFHLRVRTVKYAPFFGQVTQVNGNRLCDLRLLIKLSVKQIKTRGEFSLRAPYVLW